MRDWPHETHRPCRTPVGSHSGETVTPGVAAACTLGRVAAQPYTGRREDTEGGVAQVREREPARVKARAARAARAAPRLARVARSPLAALSAVACALVAALLAQSLASGALIPVRVAV